MAKIYGNTLATTMNPNRFQGGNGGSGGGITEQEVEQMIKNFSNAVVSTKAEKDLSNVDDDTFLSKLNAVLPDGDGVSY